MRTRLWALLVAALLVLTGCTPAAPNDTPVPTRPPDMPAAESVVATLAAGLAKFSIDDVPFVYASADAAAQLKTLTSGMGSIRPAITPGDVHYDQAAGTATASLKYEYTFAPDVTWRYETTAPLTLVGEQWKVEWAPTIVHPDAAVGSSLRYRRSWAPRAAINGHDGLALAEQLPVVRIGLDKANLDKAKWDSSARHLARVLGIDQAAYAARVAASGAQAFVVAQTVRQGELPAAASVVPGIYLQDAESTMALSPTFASGLLGVTGDATAEIIDKSNGELQAGDVVGLTGLQQRHDKRLRGTPGFSVTLRTPVASTTTPTATPAPDAEQTEAVLFEQKPVPGEPLNLTLNADVQDKAEAVLKDQQGVASLVVLRASTGEVLAAANSLPSGANPYATTGRYPPGSTFKVITSLALLRSGHTASSTVNCTSKYTVSGRSFPNYDNYPSSGLGRVPLSRAFAQSCNTAFMDAGSRLTGQQLASAAGSLGVGIDYNPGFASFYGSVPVVQNAIAHATGMIGQGQVEASPMAMAAVAASVASGKTQIPWMIKGIRPGSKAPPLSASEAATLRSLMGGVVSNGTARSLQGVVDGAKTGTAQFGSAAPYKWHAWMIAWKGDIAVAGFVYEGQSGSATAGPLVKAFFS